MAKKDKDSFIDDLKDGIKENALEFLFSQAGLITLGVVLLVTIGGIMAACGGDDGMKLKNGEGKEVTVDIYDSSSYINAVKDNDYVLAHNILDELYSNYLDAYSRKSMHLDKSTERYWNAAQYIYKAEMQWLLPQNDPEANKRLVFTLDSMTPVGNEPVSGQFYEYHQCRPYKAYTDFTANENKLRYEIVRVAMHNDNREMAEAIIKHFKPDYVEESTKEGGHGGYIFTTNWDMKTRAEQLLAE